MPDEADVTPIDNKWPKARKATVIIKKETPGPQQVYNDVDILNIPWTPASIAIDKTRYPKGVVILNEITPPDDQSTITTKDKSTFNFKISGDNSETVNIIRNSGWPCGEIILW
ncbi:MAG: hypothetical protein JSW28_06120 [Thermoplasmata archaeon]|nr:MAG: hypothetical protein JSW28_06120 [Thermoplasmata archaeon]